MTIDRDVEKVLQKVDVAITNAGYPEYRNLDITDEYADTDIDPEEKFKAMRAAKLSGPSGVSFVEAESTEAIGDDRVHFDSGVPKGLREAPAG